MHMKNNEQSSQKYHFLWMLKSLPDVIQCKTGAWKNKTFSSINLCQASNENTNL